jgi:hypothetical protein
MNRPDRQRNRIAVEVEQRGFCAQTVSSEVLHENVALLFDAPNEAVAPFFLTVVNCLDILNSRYAPCSYMQGGPRSTRRLIS